MKLANDSISVRRYYPVSESFQSTVGILFTFYFCSNFKIKSKSVIESRIGYEESEKFDSTPNLGGEEVGTNFVVYGEF